MACVLQGKLPSAALLCEGACMSKCVEKDNAFLCESASVHSPRRRVMACLRCLSHTRC